MDANKNTRVIGAPGTGKTSLILKEITALLESELAPEEVLILSPTRQSASLLQSKFDETLDFVSKGTLVRTAESFAFQVIREWQLHHGLTEVRLLTGAGEDSFLRDNLKGLVEKNGVEFGFDAEVYETKTFRDELRDFEKFLLNRNMTAAKVQNLVRGFDSQALDENERKEFHRISNVWSETIRLTEEISQLRAQKLKNQLTSSQIVDRAVQILYENVSERVLNIPRLIVVDDAQNFAPGALRILAELNNNGASIWAFGDPDVATGAFEGAATGILSGIEKTLVGCGANSTNFSKKEDLVVLEEVYRHGKSVRDLVVEVTAKIGTAGLGQQRKALSSKSSQGTVQFFEADSLLAQVGAIANTLLKNNLGLNDGKKAHLWSQMAVVCRSQEEVSQARSLLENSGVPTRAVTGGTILKNSTVVVHLIYLLQNALGLKALDARQVTEILTGSFGTFDRISLRQMQHGLLLKERTLAQEENRRPQKIDELLVHAASSPRTFDEQFSVQEMQPFLKILTNAQDALNSGATAREVLWAIWQAGGKSEDWRGTALGAEGAAKRIANQQLDAVMELFYALERHEELASATPIAEFLKELLDADIPQDSLASRGTEDAVLVTTVQGTVGAEFEIVCILGPQEGIWPNLRPRGSILGLSKLQDLVDIGSFQISNRVAVLHDELRLFAMAVSRAKEQLFVSSLKTEEEMPSLFFRFGKKYLVNDIVSERLTLRGFTAAKRRELINNKNTQDNATALAYLAENDIAGSAPETWYGVRPVSTNEALYDLENNPEDLVSVSPSQIEKVEKCPLHWFLDVTGGAKEEFSASLGTILHTAFENLEAPDLQSILEHLDRNWEELNFDAEWESEKAKERAQKMAVGITDYMREVAAGRKLVAKEASFSVVVDRSKVFGYVDRIELLSGDGEPVIVDLKTGKTQPSAKAVAENPQLLAYQLGLLEGTFVFEGDEAVTETFGATGGAELLYVHPGAQKKNETYRIFAQQPATGEQMEAFKERIVEVQNTISGNTFLARVEEHCTSSQFAVPCKLHIIPAVSHS